MKASTMWAFFLFVVGVSAFWRMPCRSQTGYGRLDPIMSPGTIADHVHAIHGGGNFGMTTSYNDLVATGSCTSCEVTQDHSAYWTPALYFMFDNGTTVMVPQVGGMLAYYLYYLSNVTAFPEGFQMIAGNKNLRHFDGPFPDTPLSFWPTDPVDQSFLQQRALGFNCLNYQQSPEPSLYRHVMPTKEQLDNDCTDGLRLELAFPSCGTGASDSPDHKSHVAYPSLVKEGNCPAGYDVHYPFLFYETIWATNTFAGDAGQFLLSYGDPVGTGYHGDFIMGWQSKEFLQEALDTCTNMSGQIQDCPLFDIQSDTTAAQCTFTVPDAIKGDEPMGPRDGLPVNVPVQYGPANATKYAVAGLETAAPVQNSAPPTTISQGPVVHYSAADPAVTATAQGGIVVNMANTGPLQEIPAAAVAIDHNAVVDTTPVNAVSSAQITTPAAAAVITAAPAEQPKFYSTSYSTVDGTVIEIVYETTVQVVTQTVTAGDLAAKHRRHMEHHKHGH